MKKTIIRIICLTLSLMFALLCLTACGGKTQTATTAPAGTDGGVDAAADLQTAGAYVSAYDGTHPQVVFTMENGRITPINEMSFEEEPYHVGY